MKCTTLIQNEIEEIDLWETLGEEAMVAWDRDVGPHMAEMSTLERLHLIRLYDGRLVRVLFVGCFRPITKNWVDVCHVAEYRHEVEPHWISSFEYIAL